VTTGDRGEQSPDLRADDCFSVARDQFGLYQKRGEILAFLRFARQIVPERACEIGTWKGGTLFLLAQLLPSLELLIGIDRQLQNEAKLRALVPPGLRLHLIEAPSAEPDTVGRVRTALTGEKLDLLFIDADHTYEAVDADFHAYRGLVREGGLIAFHDIVPDYRSRFGSEEGPWGGDVPCLWAELKAVYPAFEFVGDPEQDAYGIGAIAVGERTHDVPGWTRGAEGRPAPSGST
jgi:predicted O-methyltransferase YrrM